MAVSLSVVGLTMNTQVKKSLSVFPALALVPLNKRKPTIPGTHLFPKIKHSLNNEDLYKQHATSTVLFRSEWDLACTMANLTVLTIH